MITTYDSDGEAQTNIDYECGGKRFIRMHSLRQPKIVKKNLKSIEEVKDFMKTYQYLRCNDIYLVVKQKCEIDRFKTFDETYDMFICCQQEDGKTFLLVSSKDKIPVFIDYDINDEDRIFDLYFGDYYLTHAMGDLYCKYGEKGLYFNHPNDFIKILSIKHDLPLIQDLQSKFYKEKVCCKETVVTKVPEPKNTKERILRKKKGRVPVEIPRIVDFEEVNYPDFHGNYLKRDFLVLKQKCSIDNLHSFDETFEMFYLYQNKDWQNYLLIPSKDQIPRFVRYIKNDTDRVYFTGVSVRNRLNSVYKRNGEKGLYFNHSNDFIRSIFIDDIDFVLLLNALEKEFYEDIFDSIE